jgi:methyl-accepting chemotaxis protein
VSLLGWLLTDQFGHISHHLNRMENRIMATIEEVQADVQVLVAAQEAASAALDDLAAKVAALSADDLVSQEQLDDLDASIKAVSGALNASVAQDDPPAEG